MAKEDIEDHKKDSVQVLVNGPAPLAAKYLDVL
jgi:hypothetical protein